MLLLLVVELWLLDRPGVPSWLSGIASAVIVMIAVAAAVASERTVRARRALLVFVIAAYLGRLLYVDGHWATDTSGLVWAGATVIEGLVVLAMFEIENWRWSILPAIALMLIAAYHVIAGFTGGLIIERVLWLGQALALLGAHAVRRLGEDNDVEHAPRV